MTEETQTTRRGASVPPAVEQQIDENLKRLYQQQLEDDLPDALKSLVAKLRGEGHAR
jgi:hypothetical protein